MRYVAAALLGLMFSYVGLAEAQAATSVPLGGNAYITVAPKNAAETINDTGLHNWTSSQTVVSTYFYAGQAGTVGLSLAGYGVAHAIVQALLPGPVSRRLGERNALLVGLAFESTALLITGIATQGWIVFALLPLYALGGIGVPALQSLTTQQVGEDKQGQLQGVMASIVSLASIFGPLYFAAFYYGIKDWWPGLIWIIGVATYLIAIPIILTVRGRSPTQQVA